MTDVWVAGTSIVNGYGPPETVPRTSEYAVASSTGLHDSSTCWFPGFAVRSSGGSIGGFGASGNTIWQPTYLTSASTPSTRSGVSSRYVSDIVTVCAGAAPLDQKRKSTGPYEWPGPPPRTNGFTPSVNAADTTEATDEVTTVVSRSSH